MHIVEVGYIVKVQNVFNCGQGNKCYCISTLVWYVLPCFVLIARPASCNFSGLRSKGHESCVDKTRPVRGAFFEITHLYIVICVVYITARKEYITPYYTL